jgi:hypothetical protein
MARAVQRLAADRELRERLSVAGRGEVGAQYTAATMTRRLEELYDRLLAAHPNGRTEGA